MKRKKIKLGEVFTVDDKMYVITKPDTTSVDVNSHGHVVIVLDYILEPEK